MAAERLVWAGLVFLAIGAATADRSPNTALLAAGIGSYLFTREFISTYLRFVDYTRYRSAGWNRVTEVASGSRIAG